MGKILIKQHNGLISVIRTLLHQKQWLSDGILTLNTVVQTQKMLKAQVAQIWQLSWETLQNSTNLLLANCKLKLHRIAEEVKISEGNVFTILQEHLMRKQCSKWVQRLLTVKNSNELTIQSVICKCFNVKKGVFV